LGQPLIIVELVKLVPKYDIFETTSIASSLSIKPDEGLVKRYSGRISGRGGKTGDCTPGTFRGRIFINDA
jgi:hypothetical protein